MSLKQLESEADRIERRRQLAELLKREQGVQPPPSLDDLARLWPGTEEDGDPLEFILSERAERRRLADPSRGEG